jgi:hypothetical protein
LGRGLVASVLVLLLGFQASREARRFVRGLLWASVQEKHETILFFLMIFIMYSRNENIGARSGISEPSIESKYIRKVKRTEKITECWHVS